MSNLIDLYKTQVRILWEWRGGRWALVKRLVITLLVSTVSLVLTAALLPGISLGRVLDAVVAVVLMALFNAIVRPVLLTLVAPRSLVLLAVLVIVLQVVTFLVIAPLANGVEVDGFVPALIGSFVYAAFNTVADGHPGGRSRRLLLRPPGVEPAGEALGAQDATSPGW